MKLLIFVVATVTVLFSQLSYADDSSLLFESCISSGKQNYYYGLSNSVISCNNLKSLNDGLQIVNMAVLPASVALRTPGIKESLATELATLGLTLSNPAVLTITVVGAVGIASLYFVVKRRTEDCAKEDRETLKPPSWTNWSDVMAYEAPWILTYEYWQIKTTWRTPC
ncbi:hypothetical protein [Bdellovibrio sp.]|uniref:hypothetical protein n=1 Tax=Bdellovibrio sp. TaxID=28201 RepID=UPI0039E51AFC